MREKDGEAPSAIRALLPNPQEFAGTREEVERVKAGDARAAERLLARYTPALRCLVAGRATDVRDEALRAKLDRELLLARASELAWKGFGGFEYHGPGSLFCWLRTLVENCVRDEIEHWTAAKRDVRREIPIDPHARDTSAHSPLRDRHSGPATSVERREREERVAQAIADLPERRREIVVMRNFLGAEWVEVFEVVGGESAEAVRKEHTRCLVLLGPKLRNL